jgi:hypothetical protein
MDHDLVWRAAGPEPFPDIMQERRRWAVELPNDERAWILKFQTEWTNVSGAGLRIGSPTTEGRPDAGYGGLFWRGPRDFVGGNVVTPRGCGGDEWRGTRAEWMGFVGRHDGSGDSSSVVFVADISNPRFPPPWFLRTEPFPALGPAEFFHVPYELPPGESVKFRYGVVVAAGASDGARGQFLGELAREALTLWAPGPEVQGEDRGAALAETAGA